MLIYLQYLCILTIFVNNIPSFYFIPKLLLKWNEATVKLFILAFKTPGKFGIDNCLQTSHLVYYSNLFKFYIKLK